MSRERFPAMGTVVSVLAPSPFQPRASAVVRALFVEWERALTRFQPESELSYVNAHAGSPIRVSPLLWRVVSAALDAARATAGTFDPTMGRQIVENGYDRTFAALPTERPAPHSAPSPGGSWRMIRLDPATRSVTLPPGAQLDFGGIAKGMAVDAALETLEREALTPVLVEAGGDLRVTGVPPGSEGWSIAVELRDDAETITLFSGALATSSRLRRFWRMGDREMHHILDPHTGLPAKTGLCSVSVAAGSCVQADVAAKTAFILGVDAGRAFLERHGLSAILVEEHGGTIRTGNWPAPRSAA